MSQQLNVQRKLQLQRGGSDKNEAAPIITMEVFNDSGGALAKGDVVIWDTADSTADIIKATTTTTANNPEVLGMALETIADQAIGKVQVWGPTSALKVDGTTDIAVGDLLGTFTTAKIAAKTSGAGAFARAMEAYATNDSSGVIDAFINTLGMNAGVAVSLYRDDVPLFLGTDLDIAVVNRSTVLNATTALTGVLLGTPVTPALAANSVIISNTTASGDLLLAANNGGNSQAWLWVDSSAGTMTLYGAGTAAAIVAATYVEAQDNILLALGNDGDQVLVNRAATLNADTALTSVLVGTPVVAAIPANSMIFSNVTADGDQVFAGQTGGNSQEWLRYDASAKLVVINEDSGDVDFRVESNGNANMLVVDGGADAVGIGGAVVSGNTLTVTNAALTATGRITKLAATYAGAALTDGYGAFEVDVTLSNSPTDHSAAASAWVNITGGTVPAGTYICARNDGIYEATAATITNAKLVFGARMHKLTDDTDGLCFPWSINTSNTAITALIDVNNFSDLGTVANAGASAATLLPIARNAAGTLKYVLLYDLT